MYDKTMSCLEQPRRGFWHTYRQTPGCDGDAHSPLLCIAEAYLAVDVILPHMQPGFKRDADEQKPCDRPAVHQQWGHVAAAVRQCWQQQLCTSSVVAAVEHQQWAASKHGLRLYCIHGVQRGASFNACMLWVLLQVEAHMPCAAPRAAYLCATSSFLVFL